ncbi:MAG TPA: hypothetical protein VFX89_13695 [Gammaproteobacteria bacterium]|nr:hypothetical protein [Gammaproteobacteria bacterium]
MVAAALLLSCIVFIEAFLFLELGKQAGGILSRARDAMRVLADANRSDEEKESWARRNSGLILAMTASMAVKLAAMAAAVFAVLAGAVLISPQSEAGLSAALTSPTVIALMTLIAACYLWTRNAILRAL